MSATILQPPTDITVPASPVAQDKRQSHYIKREALYDLVWTAPVLEVARRIGVSDVALAKLCRRANIPIPPRGYWARIESGVSTPQTPFDETSAAGTGIASV